MSRRTRTTAIVFGTFVFLGISLLLARGLSGAGAERGRVLELLRAQATGDAGGVLERLPECRDLPACARQARERTARLSRRGEIEILTFTPSTRLSLTRRVGTARVAWQARGSRSPVVQCVRVRREGPLTGGGVELMAISDPIGGEAACP